MEQPPPLDDPLTHFNDASYGMYNNIVHELFLDSSDGEAEPSDALVPLIRSPSAKDEHDPPSRTAYRDLLSEAVEALRY